MKKALITSVYQEEVTIIERDKISDPEELKSYDYNNPGKMTGGKWELVRYSNGQKLWTPVHSYTFNTPNINDHARVTIEVK
jgi:hypothetical protein